MSPHSLRQVASVSPLDLSELQVVAPAAIPFDGGGGLGQDLGLRPIAPERPPLVEADLARAGVQDGEYDPAVAAETRDPLVPRHDSEHRLGGRLDEEEGAD